MEVNHYERNTAKLSSGNEFGYIISEYNQTKPRDEVRCKKRKMEKEIKGKKSSKLVWEGFRLFIFLSINFMEHRDGN